MQAWFSWSCLGGAHSLVTSPCWDACEPGAFADDEADKYEYDEICKLGDGQPKMSMCFKSVTAARIFRYSGPDFLLHQETNCSQSNIGLDDPIYLD